MSAIKINRDNLNSIKNGEKPVLLDFYAEWCGPCRMVLPIVEKIAEERPDLAVGKVNVELERELASEFGIMSIPTLVVMKNGHEVKRVTGARPEEQILEMLDS